MRIEQSNQYFNKNIGLGANLKGSSEAAAFQMTSRKPPEESRTLGASPLSQFERASNNAMPQADAESTLRARLVDATKRILELYVDPIHKEVNGELVLENEEEYTAAVFASAEIQQEKAELMQSYLDKMGIKGTVNGCGVQTIPNIISEYYVETEGDGKNLFIVELESGELMFAETDRRNSGSYEDSKSWATDFAVLQRDLFGGQKKLSDDELKKLYATFFDTNEMKAFSELKAFAMNFETHDESNDLKDLILDLKEEYKE